jgi:hypothetical protein
MLGTLWAKSNKLQNDILELSSLTDITLQELDIERIEHKSALQLLDDQDTYAQILEQQVAALEARPGQIKYIVRTETILQAGPTVTVKEIPDGYYIFRLKNGLAVAAIDKQEKSYNLLTYDLSLRGQIVMADAKANVSIQASSSQDPTAWIEVPVDLRVIDTQKRTVLEPHVGIGITGQFPWDVSGAVWSTFVHLPKGLDLGGVALLANDHTVGVGLIPLAYNVGEPLPVLTNIWVAPMATINLQGQPGGGILLGGKL